MNKSELGPYQEFIDARLKAGKNGPLSVVDLVEMRKYGDYLDHSDEFVRMLRAHEADLLSDASSCYGAANALSLIVHMKGGEFYRDFIMVWNRLISQIDKSILHSSDPFDLNVALSSIRLGMQEKMEVSTLIERVAMYLNRVTNQLSSESEKQDVWSVIINNTDIFATIYEIEKHDEASARIHDSLERLRQILRE